MSSDSDECYEASNVVAIFGFIVETLYLTACGGLTVRFWYNYHYGQSDKFKSTKNVIKTSIAEKERKDSKLIQRLGGTALILYCLSVVTALMTLILDVSMDCPEISLLTYFGTAVLYIGGFLGVMTLFTYRIAIAFENTKYQVSPRLFVTVKIIVVIVLVLTLCMVILRVIGLVPVAAGGVVGLLNVLLIVSYCVVLLRLFLSKLNGVIMDFAKQFGKLTEKQLISLTRSNSGSFDGSEMIKNSDFNFGNLNSNKNVQSKAGAPDGTNTSYVNRLINDISELKIKYTIMVIIAMISSLFFIVFAVSVPTRVINIHSPYRLELKVTLIMLSSDAFVNSLCLFLQFDFSHNFYKKLCICCHSKCQDRYTNEANKELIKSGHGNMQLQRTKSKEIVFKSNSVSNNNGNNDKKNGNNKDVDKNVETVDIVYDDQSNNVNVATGHKIINALQA